MGASTGLAPTAAIDPGTRPGPTRTPGLHRVESIMGTAIGIEVIDRWVPPGALDDAFARLRDVDATYSTYRPDSEISRLAREEIAEEDCSPEVRWVLALCEDLRRTSNGYFDIRRPDRGLDPAGLVKGWAVEEASMILEAAGARNYAINAGGDVIASGEPEPGRPWRVGIRHPLRPDRVAAVLAVRDRAVATSGGYERGDHIVDPHTGRPPRGLLSLTVVGPSLTTVDAYATAGFAMGLEGPTWIHARAGHGALAITEDERVVWTPEIDALLA
jgi:FAD:protein FMN transferase